MKKNLLIYNFKNNIIKLPQLLLHHGISLIIIRRPIDLHKILVIVQTVRILTRIKSIKNPNFKDVILIIKNIYAIYRIQINAA